MKLVGIGNYEPSHSTENDWRRAFEHLGWEVIQVQENRVESVAWLERRILDEQPDLVLYVRTWGLPVEVTDLWRRLEDRGIPSASAHLDRYYGLASPKGASVERYNMPAVDPQFKTTYTFTADGDSDDLFVRDGVNHHWLPPGVRHDEARDIAPTDEDRARFSRFDVGFVGARGYHPEHDRAGLVDALAARYGDRFVRVAGDTQYGTVRGEALNRLYATVPVWVGDSCFAGTSSRYTSDRFFETWGRGGFLIHPWLSGLGQFLSTKPDVMLGYPSWTPYEDREALFGRVDWWLAHDDERRTAQMEMAEIVRRRHTYVNRVAEMLDVIGLERPTFCCVDHTLPSYRGFTIGTPFYHEMAGVLGGPDAADRLNADDAVLWAFRYFVHHDHANAALHLSDVRYSPITFRLAALLDPHYATIAGADASDGVLLDTVKAHAGRYEEDRGR